MIKTLPRNNLFEGSKNFLQTIENVNDKAKNN